MHHEFAVGRENFVGRLDRRVEGVGAVDELINVGKSVGDERIGKRVMGLRRGIGAGEQVVEYRMTVGEKLVASVFFGGLVEGRRTWNE